MKHYIGIYDPKSRQVQFVEARRADVQSTLRHIQLERRDGEEEASKEPVSVSWFRIGKNAMLI